MSNVSILVHAMWDDEARVWVASSDDIDGLAVEAATMEALEKNVLNAITDLIEMNNVPFDGPEIPVHITAEYLAKVPNPCI